MTVIQDKVALIVAPNGARKMQDEHAALPLTPAELAQTAKELVDEGATMIHAHARDRNGKHSLDPEVNRAYIQALNKAVGDQLVVQLTTEAVGMYSPHQQMALIRELNPEAASFAIKELVPDVTAEAVAADFFKYCVQFGLIAQYILYSQQDVLRYYELREKAVIPESPHHLLFVLGRYSKTLQSSPEELLPFLNSLKDRTPWAVCAFGALEHRCASAALALGGDVRVGFENNIHNMAGNIATSNAELVRQVVQVAGAIARPVLTAEEFRELYCFHP